MCWGCEGATLGMCCGAALRLCWGCAGEAALGLHRGCVVAALGLCRGLRLGCAGFALRLHCACAGACACPCA